MKTDTVNYDTTSYYKELDKDDIRVEQLETEFTKSAKVINLFADKVVKDMAKLGLDDDTIKDDYLAAAIDDTNLKANIETPFTFYIEGKELANKINSTEFNDGTSYLATCIGNDEYKVLAEYSEF